MPSAAIKTTLDTAGSVPPACDSSDPIRQIIKTVEHKIRNLEKRKSKLESYQDLRISGKNLTADQEVAISKYEEVVQCLLCAHEFLKQIQGIFVVYEKEQKNIQRKENSARVANEVFKVRETLILQDFVQKMRASEVRRDFEAGSNGAVKLDSEDLMLVDKLLAEGFVSLDEANSEDAFAIHAHRAADHWVSTVDGKPKQFSTGVSYERVRRVVRSIQDCGYFQQRFKATDAESANGHERNEEEQTTNGNHESTETPSSMDTMSVLSGSDTNNQPQPQVTLSTGDSVTATSNDPSPIPVLQADGGVQQQQQPQVDVVQEAPAPVPEQVFVNGFAQPQEQQSLHPIPTLQQPLPATPIVDPHALPEELHTVAFTFLQDSELDDHNGLLPAVQSGPENGMQQHTPNSHPSTVPPPHQQPQQQQQQQQSIPTQQPNLLLINPMLSMSGIVPGQSHPLDQLVNGGGAVPNGLNAGGVGGGVTPPMFSFPFQNPTVANIQMQNGRGGAAAATAAIGQQQQHLNPVQQLVKTLNVPNFTHHQLPNAPIMMHQMNGNQQHRVVMPMGASAAAHNVAPGFGPAMVNAGLGNAVPENGNRENVVEASPLTTHNVHQGPVVGSSPSTPAAVPEPMIPSGDQPMTISEWDPVGKKDNNTNQHNNHHNHNHHQQKREASTESSSGGGERRRDDRRSMGGNGGGHGGGRQNGGGNDTNGGYTGSRRRYMDRSNTNGGGGVGGANYNGSRMQRNGSGGPVGGDVENGNSYGRGGAGGGGGGKPHHFNRMANGGAGGNGGGSNGGSGTFYRNNDPSYYNQNGVGMKSGRGHAGGYNQPRQSPATAGNRN